MQSHLLSLQQQLKTLTEGHTKLGQAVAALKAAAAPTGSTESKAGSQAGQQVADRAAAFSTGAASASSPAPSTGAIAASSPVPSIGADAASSPAPSTGAAAANSLPELQGQSNLSVQPGVASGIQNGDFAQRLDALADEVTYFAFNLMTLLPSIISSSMPKLAFLQQSTTATATSLQHPLLHKPYNPTLVSCDCLTTTLHSRWLLLLMTAHHSLDMSFCIAKIVSVDVMIKTHFFLSLYIGCTAEGSQFKHEAAVRQWSTPFLYFRPSYRDKSCCAK